MEIESSGRSIDRSRELAVKKARIGEDVERERDHRGFHRVIERERSLERQPQRGSPLLERFRAIEREREREGDRRSRSSIDHDDDRIDKDSERERDDSSSRGGGQQELVSQYKTALGELTINSKPIITNLTIIAGENIHAAKSIAATVCDNILKVPKEQKLPSLYLLDSIVKNIGKDYVKFFAARLPEVFCKAYRQVDPAIHKAMRHLFRTWRGVFDKVPLNAIEDELQLLQYSPSVNGSDSGTATPRSSDSQSQRPGHSIHVNPKYLEARQRLQQSNRTRFQAEGANSENNGDEPIHESERSERSMHASPKAWSEAPLKRPNIQRPPRGDAFNEPGYGQKASTGYVDYDFGIDRVRSSEMGMGKPNERVTERDDGLERPWYRERIEEPESSTANVPYSQRNGYDWQKPSTHGALIDSYGNYRGPRAARGPISHLPPPQDIDGRNSRVMSRNWQNSEEEEYMWDSMSTRSVDHGRGNDKMRKDDWFSVDTDKSLGLGRGKRMRPETDLPDGNWRRPGPLSQMDQPMGGEDRIHQRELDDPLPSSLLQHDIGSRNSREGLMETSNLLRPNQNALGHRPLSVWPPQHLSLSGHSRPRTPSMDLSNHSSVNSINVVQSDGQSISSLNGSLSTSIGLPSGPRPSFRTNNGISLGTGPPSFGALPTVTPVSSGLSSRQRQSPNTSPSLPSLQQLPGSPSSALPLQQPLQPVQHQKQNNFIKPDHIQVQNLPTHPSRLVQQTTTSLSQMQHAPQPQNTQDSLHQLPHSHVQSGSSLQHLQMPQQIQPSQHFQNPPSAVPPLHGNQIHFSQQAPTEPPLPQIQPVSLSQPLIPSHALQHPGLRSPPQPPPPSYGPPQSIRYVSSGISTIASPSLQGTTSTQSLLAAILQSGLFPSGSSQVVSSSQPISSSGFSGFSDLGSTHPTLHIQPPLPSGPPPVQLSTTTTVSLPSVPVAPLPPMPISSISGATPAAALAPPPTNLPLLPSHPPRIMQPPLPPGPPPASSLVGSASQVTSSVTTPPVNPYSVLLNSLVANGLFPPPAESTSSSLSLPATSLMSNQQHNLNTALQASSSVPFVGVATVSTTVTVPPIPACAVPPLETSSEMQGVKDPIGFEFKQEIIREHHASVINGLYDDFPRQCRTCGLRFKFQEEHSKHMDWHASKNREQKSQKKISRQWFACVKDWRSGTGVLTSDVAPSFLSKDANLQAQDNEQLAVPADDNQSVCALCGEPFEEFYSDETDEWMYRGAVYVKLDASSEGSIEDKDSPLSLVHVKCRSESTTFTLEDSEGNDADDDDDLGCRRIQY